jgi:hypothetical protein
MKKSIGHFVLTRSEKGATTTNGSYGKILIEKRTTISEKQEETLLKKETITAFFDDPNLTKSQPDGKR